MKYITTRLIKRLHSGIRTATGTFPGANGWWLSKHTWKSRKATQPRIMIVMRQTACLVVNPSRLITWQTSLIARRGLTVGFLLLQRFRVGLLLSTRLIYSQWWILIYMFAVFIYWWVEVLHKDWTTSTCIWTTAEPRVRLLQHKPGLNLLVIYYWPFQGDASVVVYCNCQCLSAFCLSFTYCSI